MSFTLNISYIKFLLEIAIDTFIAPATLTKIRKKQLSRIGNITKMPNFLSD